MGPQAVATTKRLAAERQIHAAIAHYRAGEFECAITLCSAAEGQTTVPPGGRPHLRSIINEGFDKNPPEYPNKKKRDKEAINFVATWLKHETPSPDEIEILDWEVIMWLNRAISKYRAAYGSGTPEMVAMFDWAGNPDQGRLHTAT